nr:hypothetical protein I308_04738 [Cryptococcus tetragattii IND107]
MATSNQYPSDAPDGKPSNPNLRSSPFNNTANLLYTIMLQMAKKPESSKRLNSVSPASFSKDRVICTFETYDYHTYVPAQTHSQAKPGPALYSRLDPQIRVRAPLPLVSQDRPSLATRTTPHHVHGNVAKDIPPAEYRPRKSHSGDRPCTTGLITSAATPLSIPF